MMVVTFCSGYNIQVLSDFIVLMFALVIWTLTGYTGLFGDILASFVVALVFV